MMKQEIFRFDFRFKNQDVFCINSKNSLAYNLIQSWPKWQNKIVFIYGPKNCGKTTISKIWIEKTGAKSLEKKNSIKTNFKIFETLDYYDGLTFKIIAKKGNSKCVICSGGRLKTSLMKKNVSICGAALDLKNL